MYVCVYSLDQRLACGTEDEQPRGWLRLTACTEQTVMASGENDRQIMRERVNERR